MCDGGKKLLKLISMGFAAAAVAREKIRDKKINKTANPVFSFMVMPSFNSVE
jgi:hypothetical protein